MVFYSFVIFFVTVTINIHMVDLLRLTNFYVPRRASNQVEIDCKYDVEGKKLYDVKWYKDGQQFFRCAGDGTVNEFEVDGVMVLHPRSASVGACPLTLIVLTTKSSGEYKCEVTLDTDGFPMVWQSSRLDFLLPPKRHDPEIVPQGSERRTSEEETETEKHTLEKEAETKAGCKGLSSNIILLLIMYFIFT
ncbi:uncharacterized protein LOC108915174 [Anoplophora glabripennis]|uniref:uncharacterized protein LOC108915174 n=1 Tax=Anoplophora glabripennis TaxID=217634 RepID=UPI00087468B6|nr:uncharacterized protein LOC108915174 [Anoplophora glabripennis]